MEHDMRVLYIARSDPCNYFGFYTSYSIRTGMHA